VIRSIAIDLSTGSQSLRRMRQISIASRSACGGRNRKRAQPASHALVFSRINYYSFF